MTDFLKVSLKDLKDIYDKDKNKGEFEKKLSKTVKLDKLRKSKDVGKDLVFIHTTLIDQDEVQSLLANSADSELISYGDFNNHIEDPLEV